MMPDDLPYRVSWSRTAVEALNELARRASDPIRRAELARVARAIDDRLRRAPLTLGEAYRARGAVEERLAVVEFLAVDFAADAVRKFVLVRKVHALSGPGV
jgi:hypothetical protein